MNWSKPISFIESELINVPHCPGIYEIGIIHENNNFKPLYLEYSDNTIKWAYYIHEQTKSSENHPVGKFGTIDTIDKLQFRWCVINKPRQKCIELINTLTHGDGSTYMYLPIFQVKKWKNTLPGIERHHTNKL